MTFFIISAALLAALIGYSLLTFQNKMNKIRQLKTGDNVYVINYDETDEAGVIIYEKCKVVEVRFNENNKLDSVIIINQSGQTEVFEKEFVVSNDFIIPIKF